MENPMVDHPSYGTRGPLCDEANALVTVGDGRGFVVRSGRDLFVITAAHCLPHLPPACSAADEHERSYGNLLGPIGGKLSVSVACAFVDPIADIAILRSIDCQAAPDLAEQWDTMMDTQVPLTILDRPSRVHLGEPKLWRGTALMISLDRRPIPCIATCMAGNLGGTGAPLWIEDAAEPIRGGMSGSPILAEGAAIGIVAVSNGCVTDDGKELGRAREGGPNPRLADHLPRWFSICA
jgi:hypothetical protein